MTNIIPFPTAKDNGARKALIVLLATAPRQYLGCEEYADWLLMGLWECGYKVVPVDGDDAA